MTRQRVGHAGIELTPEHPIDEVADLASHAETAGYDAVFVANHYFNRDPFAALIRIASVTDEIGVGTAGANPYDTHPVTLASRLATLQEASDGRAIFGVGPGDASALNSLGIDRERPLRRVLETLQVARQLWDGERVSHDGTFSTSDAGLEYDVERPPAYVAAQGPHMLRMGAKYGDGLLVNAAHPRDLSWATDRVAEGRAERDDGVDPEVLAYASVSIDENHDEARSLARRPVAFIAAGASPHVLDRHGLDSDRAEQIGQALERGAFHEAFDAVTPAMIDALSVAGSPEDVTERLAAIDDVVDGIVVGSPLGPDLRTAIDLAAEAIEQATQ
ncbi:5,10-methylenetetrahydromethanopterin reductase [Salinarchaeum sp. Harcht-Bsk1]|uniref:5,10-methylenetetrahydromethanopterin reductase n=1 Tax=Salinarchaeum sp. Harcht-Bsk1 TaxID=1333523 RepID=UPI000677B256|nr:5,10-methylenetetrahydromethanopterin reductase [Salinarchaeum sp. Harcht-Bsk1]